MRMLRLLDRTRSHIRAVIPHQCADISAVDAVRNMICIPLTQWIEILHTLDSALFNEQFSCQSVSYKVITQSANSNRGKME